MASSLLACGGQPAPELCTQTGRTYASVVTKATFARTQQDQSVEGLNIDGVVSDGTDEAGCYKPDAVAPDGTRGIDNEIATLLPLVESFVGKSNIDAVLSQAITNGQLIIMMAVRGVDDLQNDSCVDVAFGAGTGTVFLDTSGRLLPYQTFAWNLALDPVSTLYHGGIKDGVLTAGPGDVEIPVRILDAKFNLQLHLAKVQMKVSADPLRGGATLSGLTGGGIEVDDLAAFIKSINIGDSVKSAIVPVLSLKTDLAERDDGACHELSTALDFETTPVFIQGE